ncbi:MAG TPA: PQQ-binding-like beta-propeller repeat protein [Pirellulales bacterium]|jgi:outer membrane protein assembly factor BamB
MIARCSKHVLVCFAFIIGIFSSAQLARAENWPQWRGPRGNSTSAEAGLPIEWSDSQGVLWKAELPEWGSSTPAIWGTDLFITTQHDDELLVLKFDARSGKLAWTQKAGAAATVRDAPKRKQQKFHQLHNLASPSPVTDGRTVVVHFGNGDLVAYDFSGHERWRHNLQDEYGAYTIWWGHANSPVIYEGAVISACMQDSLADVAEKPMESYLVAHDLETGELLWKSSRMTKAAAEQCDAYTTPVLFERGGHKELVVMGGNQLDAYDPATGKQLWFLAGLVGGRTVTGPTAADGLLFVTRGMRGPLIAVKPNGSGELSDSAIVWKQEKGTPDTPCPTVAKGILLSITDDGIARAFDATTGHQHWTQRLTGDYKASPLAADGHVYFLNTRGLCTVVKLAAEFEKIAENQLSDTTLASPAVSEGRIYIRGRTALYCVGSAARKP